MRQWRVNVVLCDECDPAVPERVNTELLEALREAERMHHCSNFEWGVECQCRQWVSVRATITKAEGK